MIRAGVRISIRCRERTWLRRELGLVFIVKVGDRFWFWITVRCV